MATIDNAQKVFDSTKFLSSTLSLNNNKVSAEKIIEPKMDESAVEDKTLVKNLNVSSEVFIDP